MKKNIIITKEVVQPTTVTLVKKYNTSFERMCLENTSDFQDMNSLKELKKLYNREGCLKVGDKFFTYENSKPIRKLMIGKVTGVNTYEVERIYYDADEICLILENREKVEERKIEVSEKRFAFAEKFSSTVFSKKEYIPYNEYICNYLICTFEWAPNTRICWHNSLFGNEAEEWTVAKYIFKMNKEIVAIYKRLRRSKEEDSYHIAVIDKNSIGFVVNAMDGFDVIIDIPNTKMAILMLQWKK